MHLLIRQCSPDNIDTLEFFLFKHGADSLRIMAKTRDEYNKLPYDYIAEKESASFQKYLHDLVWPHTHDKECLPLTQFTTLVNEKSLSYKLHYNLQLAIELINYVRRDNLRSSTHPTTKNEAIFDLGERIGFLREKIKAAKQDLFLNESSEKNFSQEGTKVFVRLNEKMRWQQLQLQIELIKKFNVGNCGEMTLLAYYYSLLLDRTVTRAMIGFTDSSHIALIIGLSPNADVNNYRSWGDETVICDTWLCEAYPAAQLEMKFKGHRTIEAAHKDKIYNVLVHYNPEYHRLKIYRLATRKNIDIEPSLIFASKFNLIAQFEKLTPKEKALFTIQALLHVINALEKKRIKEEDIPLLTQPFHTLFALSDKRVRTWVKKAKFSLLDIECLYPKPSISRAKPHFSKLFSSTFPTTQEISNKPNLPPTVEKEVNHLDNTNNANSK